MLRKFAVIVAAAVITGCATDAEYSCGIEPGIGCKSVNDIYEMSVNGELKETKAIPLDEDEDGEIFTTEETDTTEVASLGEGYPVKLQAGSPLRQPPKILRIWIAPWVDASGDFHEQSFVYTVVSEGRWLLGENKTATETALEEFGRIE